MFVGFFFLKNLRNVWVWRGSSKRPAETSDLTTKEQSRVRDLKVKKGELG